jgi:Na+-driven multidrug efflux pump
MMGRRAHYSRIPLCLLLLVAFLSQRSFHVVGFTTMPSSRLCLSPSPATMRHPRSFFSQLGASSTPPPSSSISQPSIEDKTHSNRLLTKQFFDISLPTFLQLSSDPLAGLIDTAYIGRLGPQALAGAGIAISANYALSKLYCDPLLRTSISLVASALSSNEVGVDQGDEKTTSTVSSSSSSSTLSTAVTTSLLLALLVGIVQLAFYLVLANRILAGMGVTYNADSNTMFHHAIKYLQFRALGTPAATLWLVTNGIYRGLGETRVPLFFSLLFTALNLVLSPIFIFGFNMGVVSCETNSLASKTIN